MRSRPRHAPLLKALIFALALAPGLAPAGSPLGQAVAPSRAPREAVALARALDGMDVEHHWLAGAHVNWRTGDPDGRPVGGKGAHTHCSAFAAAACERLGVYLLRPPAASQEFLANAQYRWLLREGQSAGWTRLDSGLAAQRSANGGFVVLACYANPNPKKAGHIALVRPSTRGPAAVRAEGPEIIQAGMTNFNRTSLKEGFRHHPGAWERGEILYFAHDPLATR